MADIREELELMTPKSKEAFERNQEVMATLASGSLKVPHPIYIGRAHGARVVDVDDNEYIDVTMGFGPHILGHAPEIIVNAVTEAAQNGLQWALHNPYQEPLARLVIEASPCAEKVFFVNTGTEATIYATRAARAHTGKKKIGIFEGAYHGSHDTVLIRAVKDSPVEAPTFKSLDDGILPEDQANVIILPYRNTAAFDIIRKHKDELAVVMIEPAQSSNPQMVGDFLRDLQNVCKESGVLFMLDEVITGFRMAFGGAQEFFDITPDLVTYGKVLGGGMPIGAVAGSAEIMDVFSRGPGIFDTDSEDSGRLPGVFMAGTFNGNPITMAAGHAVISYLKENKDIYRYLAEQGNRMADEINQFCQTEEVPAQMMNALSLFHIRFQSEPIERFRDIDNSLSKAEEVFYMHLLKHGVMTPADHLAFLSSAHTPEDIDHIIDSIKKSFIKIREEGLI